MGMRDSQKLHWKQVEEMHFPFVFAVDGTFLLVVDV